MKLKNLLSLMVVVLAAPAHATSGAEGMALQLICQTYQLGSGNLMLMAGFLLAVYGLYRMISAASYKSGLILIIVGALLTALPGLIFSFLQGTNIWLFNSGITTTNITSMLNSIKGYAATEEGCEQIHVDLSQYNEAMDGGYIDVRGAVNNRGSGARNMIDPDSEPIQSPTGVGEQSPCLGKVVDISGQYKAKRGDNYGMRKHPTLGYTRLHAGMDINEIPHNSHPNIIAANAGKVISSGKSGCGGNIVTIEHGGGVTTKYMHLLNRGVRVGESVSAGQILGQMGSTGTCTTGIHLHFEWRENDKPTNPAPKIGC